MYYLCEQGRATTPVSSGSKQTGQTDSSCVATLALPVDWQRAILIVSLGGIGLVKAFKVFLTRTSFESVLGGSALITVAVVGVVVVVVNVAQETEGVGPGLRYSEEIESFLS